MSADLTLYSDPLTLIDQAVHLAESTRKQYKKAVRNYMANGGNLADAQALTSYAQELPSSSCAFLKAAVRLLTEGMATTLKGQAVPDNVNAIQAALYRIEALQEAIPTKQHTGQKAHTWLNLAQVKALLDTCEPAAILNLSCHCEPRTFFPGRSNLQAAGGDCFVAKNAPRNDIMRITGEPEDIVGQRDRLVLGLLVGAGLRREELANLCFEDVKLQPVADRFRTVIDVQGKGAKDRIVPISDPLANALDEWGQRVEHKGHIARSLGRSRKMQDTMSTVAIFNVVQKRGAMIEKPKLAPHDLRRTYAQLGYEAGIPITQISKLLGHASVATTQRYLNLELDLEVTISDFIPF